MTRFLLLLLLTCLLPSQLLAQNAELDSLLQLLKAETLRDTTRVRHLIDIHGHLILSDATSSLPYIEEAMEISQELNYADGIGFSENAMGMYHMYAHENYERALEHVLSAVHVFDSVGNRPQLLIVQNNLALIYKNLDQFEDSRDIYEKIYAEIEPLGVNNQLLATCNNLGLVYQELSDYENALVWYHRLYTLSEEIGSDFGMMMANGNLSTVYELLQDYPKMLDYSNKALKQSTALGSWPHVSNSYQAKGRALGELGRLKEAVYNLKLSDSLAIATSSGSVARGTQLFLAEYLEKLGDYEQALKYLKQAKLAEDTTSANENRKTIEEMRVKFKTEEAEKEKELAQLEAEKLSLESKQSRNQTIGIALIALLVILLGGLQMNRMQAKKKAELLQLQLKQTEEEARWKEQLRQSRMSALKSQMNPHFIFNALNSVQSLFYRDEKEKASKYLGRFSKLMRKVLEMSDRPTVSLEDELEALTTYLELEKLRFEDAFSYSIDIDDEVEDDMIMVPSMLIQPYVENALKHGLSHKEGSSELNISVKLDSEENLKVSVTDNGIGREAAYEIRRKNNPDHRSFASEATAQRLDLLNNNRSSKLVVTYTDLSDNNGKPTGTKVSIIIPLST